MNIIFKEISIRNFLSFGNVPQVIKLNENDLRMITGYNRDKSDSNEDKNGVGKSTVFQAIHYALFGKSIGNTTNLSWLVNNINGKNMVISLTFMKDDIEYTIIRGRSPNILKLLKNGDDVFEDNSQGDSRETQKEIERILGFGDDLYNQLFNLTCQVPLFLKQSTANQKAILEQILGVDTISKKIVSLKELIKETKNNLNNETFKYNTIKTQNETLSATINKQIVDMNNAKNQWESDIKEKIKTINSKLLELNSINIEEELKNFQLIDEYNKKMADNELNKRTKLTLENEITSLTNRSLLLVQQLNNYANIDFQAEAENIKYNTSLQADIEAYKKSENEHNQMIMYRDKTLSVNFQNVSKQITQKQQEIDNIKDGVCPTCGQAVGVEETNTLRSKKTDELNILKESLHKIDMEILEVNNVISSFEVKTFELKPVRFNTLQDIETIKNSLISVNQELEEINSQIVEKKKIVESISIETLGEKPTTHYQTLQDALKHQTIVESLNNSLVELNNSLKTNPFEQQERSIEEMKKNLMVLDDSAVKTLDTELLHQETLLKLLNSPTSFIRKTILDKSLEYLNQRITMYLDKMNSMHSISFNNDMTINISKMGVEYGYVSSGEEGRVNIALIFAFRDVWEALNNCNVNIWFFDEVIDRLGLDEAGVYKFTSLIKSRSDKNSFMVTHNPNLLNQSDNVMVLVKENDFTKIMK